MNNDLIIRIGVYFDEFFYFNGEFMSLGYLVITSKPCSVLTQTRGQAFSLIEEKPNQYIYFRFCEGSFYTERMNKKEAVITDRGMDFFRHVYRANQGRFLFADTLLEKRESEMEFVKVVSKQLAEKKVTVIRAEKGRKINLRQAYFIEINQQA